MALVKMVERGQLLAMPPPLPVAAISVGVVQGEPVLDLDYREDLSAMWMPTSSWPATAAGSRCKPLPRVYPGPAPVHRHGWAGQRGHRPVIDSVRERPCWTHSFEQEEDKKRLADNGGEFHSPPDRNHRPWQGQRGWCAGGAGTPGLALLVAEHRLQRGRGSAQAGERLLDLVGER